MSLFPFARLLALLLLLLAAVPAIAADTQALPDSLRTVDVPNRDAIDAGQSTGQGGPRVRPALAANASGGASGPHVIERIAATVNDDIITGSDLSNRIALAFFTSGLQPTPENQARIAPQVLRTMIDETLQRQEAKRNSIIVDKAEVDKAVDNLAAQNHMPAEQLQPFLAQHGVKLSALRSQVETGLLWSRVIQRELRPDIEVGDEEIDTRLAQIQANAGKPEYLVAEIFVRVDNPSDDAQAKAFMDGLRQQMESGAPFSALAQQFSQSAGALQGGDLGWIQAGQLSPELDHALVNMQKGDLSEPIRDSGGYHLLLVRDTRLSAGADAAQVQVSLKQISITQGAMSDQELIAASSAAQAATAVSAPGCGNLENDVKAKAPAATVTSLDAGSLNDLPGWLGATVQGLQVGQVSDPLAVDGGAAMVVLCSRTQPSAGLPSRDEVLNQIGTERLELAARRLMRDLRREAAIDVKIGKSADSE